jgi:uncharacterized delta-60 repeat protein
MKTRPLALSCFLALVFIASGAISIAAQGCPGAAGCLDPTFGAGGTTQTYIPAVKPLTPAKIAKQSDGKVVQLILVLPGDSFSNAIVRYNSDGSLDTSFGNGGIATLNWSSPSNSAHAFAIAIQMVGTEERIVLAGTGTGFTSSLRVDRFLPDGSTDTSFGSGGTVSITAGAAEDIVIQPDGKIVTMGTAGALVRLNVNGTLDTTFGSGGFIQNNTWHIWSVALQSDGKIIGAGYWTDVKGRAFGSAWRFNKNGSLDDGTKNDSTKGDSFGKGGQALIDTFNAAWDVKIDASGRAVIGASTGSGNTDFAVARLTTSGQLDSTFGVGGKTTVDFSGMGDQVRSVVLQANGKIILIGFTNNANGSDAGFVRLNSNGTLDSSFGQRGKAVSDLSSEGQSNYFGLIQLDPICGCEKLITPGTLISGGIYYAVVARYLLL